MDAVFRIGQGFLASTEGGHSTSLLGIGAYLLLVLGIIFGTMALSKPGINNKLITNPLTLLYEHLYLFIENMCVGIIGPQGRKYVTMIMTLWLVIFVSNVVALFFPMAPTAVLSFNLGMAVLCVVYVQYEGIRANGLFGHVKHFAGPKLTGVLILMSAFIFVIEVVSELMKNISLSLRLFGNIHGGHEAVSRMNDVGAPILVPLGEFLLPIKFLTAIVQALIFSLLTCAYISLVTHHEEDHSSHGDKAPAH